MKKFKIISYATKNTPYMEEINKYLIPSLKRFNLDYTIEYPDDKGDWQKNTGYKSTFILNMLNKYKHPLVFVDADAEFLKYPELFDKIDRSYDLGVHFLDWGWFWHKTENYGRRDLLSGTMYIPYKEKTINFIKKCIDGIAKNPNVWEQKIIQKVLDKEINMKIYELPLSYITFPRHDGKIPEHCIKKEDIVILHHQASRNLKNRNMKMWDKYKK